MIDLCPHCFKPRMNCDCKMAKELGQTGPQAPTGSIGPRGPFGSVGAPIPIMPDKREQETKTLWVITL
jgi:hypothetical protein